METYCEGNIAEASTSAHAFECNIVKKVMLFQFDTLDQTITKDLVRVSLQLRGWTRQ